MERMIFWTIKQQMIRASEFVNRTCLLEVTSFCFSVPMFIRYLNRFIEPKLYLNYFEQAGITSRVTQPCVPQYSEHFLFVLTSQKQYFNFGNKKMITYVSGS